MAPSGGEAGDVAGHVVAVNETEMKLGFRADVGRQDLGRAAAETDGALVFPQFKPGDLITVYLRPGRRRGAVALGARVQPPEVRETSMLNG